MAGIVIHRRSRAAQSMRLFSTSLLAILLPSLAYSDWQSLRAEGGITATHQRETNGDRLDTGASGDFFLYLPVSRGEWMLHVESATSTSPDSLFSVYPESNSEAGTAQDSDGGSRLQISELYYRWTIDSGKELTLGEIDPSGYLDRSRIANDENSHFLGASFVNNPTIDFPDYALGLMYRLKRNESSPEITAILSSSDGLADNPGRSYRELIDISDAGKAPFAGLGARWSIRNTRIGVGGWYRSDEHPDLTEPELTLHNYGLYGVNGWQDGNNGVNFRIGAARDADSPAQLFVGAAHAGVTRVGAVGIGVGKIYKSSRLDGPGYRSHPAGRVFSQDSPCRGNLAYHACFAINREFRI
jgi:hypothetical protein